MIEALRAAKESLHSSAVTPPPAGEAKADQEQADKRPDVPEHNRAEYWLLIIGACPGNALIVSKLQQTRRPASGPAIKLSADKPPDAKQLKVSPDPFIME